MRSATKAGIAVLLGLGAAIGGAFFVGKAKAAPPEIPPKEEEFIPTPEDIMAAKQLEALDVYYSFVGQLLLAGKIDINTYRELYQAYVSRFQELVGVR